MHLRTQNILSGIIKNKRVANAYLFSGGDSNVKIEAAIQFAMSLNCLEESVPCEKCQSCKKIRKNVHPDVVIIEKEGLTIRIDQIRALKEITKYGPCEGRWQIVIINEAHTITPEAANSFLKILEEPANKVIFILIDNSEGTLPKTVLSRCQKIIFEEPNFQEPQKDLFQLVEMIEKSPLGYISASEMVTDRNSFRDILQQMFIIFATAHKIRQAKLVIDLLRGIERNANHKLAMDVLCLKLWNKN